MTTARDVARELAGKYSYRAQQIAAVAVIVAILGLVFANPRTVSADVEVIILTSGTTWNVPSDWNNNENTIEVIGGGGGGGDNTVGAGGGGGGAYSKVSNVALTPGGTVGYSIGSGGATETAGGDTWFCNSTSNCTSISDTAVVVGAKGGGGSSTGTTGGTGGAAASGVGDVKYSGGNGGNGSGAGADSSGGGGGAAGPGGDGKNGGGGDTNSNGDDSSGGGGGAGGGSSTAGSQGSTSGGSGGHGPDGTGGGSGGNGTDGGAGSNGGGGGGSDQCCAGGAGGNGVEWTTAGAGGGGGGGNTNGGNGGLYGGGGGGGDNGTAGTGAQGVIVITYAPFGEHLDIKFTRDVMIAGDAYVTESVSKGSGTFVIDHPLDPKNKLLYHSFVESPDLKNLYDGIAELDENGEAVIELPRYFLALNRDYRYLVTPLGEPMPNLFIDKEVSRKWFGLSRDIVFRISGGKPYGRVSWQVTGNRQDPYALEQAMPVEVEKGSERALLPKGECLLESLCE